MSTGEVINTSSTGGQKAGNQVRASLLPWEQVMDVAELYGKGAEKYDAHNWMKGYDWSLSHDALHRHLSEWWLGREFDDGEGGTGLEHLTAVVFHAFALMYFRKNFPEFDDRPGTVMQRLADEKAAEAVADKHAGPLGQIISGLISVEDQSGYKVFYNTPESAVSVVVGGDNPAADAAALDALTMTASTWLPEDETPTTTHRLTEQWTRAHEWKYGATHYRWIRNGNQGTGWYFSHGGDWEWSCENGRANLSPGFYYERVQ